MEKRENYGLWRLRIRAARRVKGVWNVVESNESGISDTITSSGGVSSLCVTISAAKSSSSIKIKREKASGIIISALGDYPLRVVLEADDGPSKMIKLLDRRYASKRTGSRIAVETQLFGMSYNGQIYRNTLINI